jgi:hypothetical protein
MMKNKVLWGSPYSFLPSKKNMQLWRAEVEEVKLSSSPIWMTLDGSDRKIRVTLTFSSPIALFYRMRTRN